MATAANTHGTPSELTAAKWSPARVYLVASGIFLVVSTAIGFAVDSSFQSSPDAVRAADHGFIYGVFATNGWHNVSGMASGVAALLFALRPEWSRTGALVKGAIYVVVTSSVAIWGGHTFLIATNVADQIVHGTLAVTGLAAGFATPARSKS